VAAMAGVDLAEIAITSSATLLEGEGPDDGFTVGDIAGVVVTAALAKGKKCERCWQVLEEVGENDAEGEICNRCADAVGDVFAAAS